MRPVAALLLVACTLTAVLTAGAPGAESRDTAEPAHEKDPALAIAAREAFAREARRAASLQTPEARAERLHSRTAFGSQSADEAQATARRHLEHIFDTPAFSPTRGRRVEQFLGPNAARVAGERGDRIVIATVPLRRPTGTGDDEAVDLSMRPAGAGFAPVAPLVGVRFARRVEDGLELDGGVRLAPVGSSAAAAGVLDGDNVFYANSRPDTDVLVRPIPYGAETFEILRSQESPEVLAWRLTLPSGASAREGAGGGPAVEVVEDGRVVAALSHARAIDAYGRRVDVSTALDGDTVRLTARHRGEDVAYPIVVDPVFERYEWECQQGTSCAPTGSFAGWRYWASAPAHRFQEYAGPGYLGTGLYVRNLWSDNQYFHSEKGEWVYEGPGSSMILRAQYHNLSQDNVGGSNTCYYTGIWAGGRQPGYWEGHPDPITCAQNIYNQASLKTSPGSRDNIAVFGTWIEGDGRRSYFMDHAGWVELEVRDEDRPVFDVDAPAGWTNREIPVTVGDHGVGLKSASVTGASPFSSSCNATFSGELCPQSHVLRSNPPEGITELTGTATDATGYTTALGRGLTAVYYDNVNFTGSTVRQVEPQIDLPLNWGRPTPSIAADGYSVRWEGRIRATTSGTYTFTAAVDDRARLWINGAQVINATCCGDRSGQITLQADQLYSLRMETEQDGGPSSAQLFWTPPGGTRALVPSANLYPPANGLRADVFDTIDFTGPRYRWTQPNVDADFGGGSPDARLNPDTFSVRWTGQVAPRFTEAYTFYTVADDRTRLWVDGRLLLDQWNDQPALEATSSTIALEAGKRYDVRLDYVENGGSASAKLLWSSPSQGKEVVPESRLSPPSDTGPVIVKIDRSPPTSVQRSGPLVDRASSPIATATGLAVTAQDGTTAVPASGVASAQMLVDGQPANDSMAGTQLFTQRCTIDSCPLSTTLTFDPANLRHGLYQVSVDVKDALGQRTQSAPVRVSVDKEGPRLTPSGELRDRMDGWLRAGDDTVHVVATDGSTAQPGFGVRRVELLVDGLKASEGSPVCVLQTNCPWEGDLALGSLELAEGTRRIELVGFDVQQQRSAVAWQVKVDKTAPSVSLGGALAGLDGRWVNGGSHALTIGATDAGSGVVSAEVTVDGIRQQLFTQTCTHGGCALERTWTLDTAPLAAGDHLVQVTVLDAAGGVTVKYLTVGVDRTAPALSVTGLDGGTTISGDRVLHLAARDDPGAGVRDVDILVDGHRTELIAADCAAQPCEVDRDWTLDVGELTEGAHVLRAIAADKAGNTDAEEISFDYQPNGPPQPDALESNKLTPFHEQTEFLYTGENPVQTGVAPNTIEKRRAGVIRGKVTERDGTPIAGVRATVLGHPAFGESTTRTDGELYMAVNGGGPLTVRLERAGYLPVDRQVDVPWQGFAHLDPTVMIPFDPNVTAVETGVLQPLQVHRGTRETDMNGSRQVTLLFPRGTTAEMEMQDGSRQPLPTFHVRATEYTVGDTGPAAMPAPLPPTSAYTYAADFSVDEARAAGARHVHFSKPVVGYLENFRDAPVGGRVPNGYYERSTGQWVPDTDGRVVKVIREENGRAVLEIHDSTPEDNHKATDTDTPATETELAQLGIDDEELQKVAALYEPGQELWRVPTQHFSDWNYNFFIIGAALDPSDWFKKALKQLVCGESGSVIECENQTLGEDVSLTGTGAALHYRSDRVRGRSGSRILEIPLLRENVPSGLRGVEVKVEVAGRQFAWTGDNRLPAVPHQTLRFRWDGKDAFGRTVNGAQRVDVKIGFAYRVQYSTDPTPVLDSLRGFGAPPQGARWNFFIESIVCDINGCSDGAGRALDLDALNSGPPDVFLWKEFETTLGGWDARSAGLGGWTLTPHHQYDPIGKTLYRGDGTRQKAEAVTQSVERFAGVAGSVIPRGDGGPAIDAELDRPEGVAVGADGSVYIADMHDQVIRRVRPDGIIERFAGTYDAEGFAGDGGPATSAKLNFPTDVDVDPDGSIYITDTGNKRIRRVATDGTIATVAGGSTQTNFIPGGYATEMRLTEPNSTEVASDGTLYVADGTFIRRVAPGGRIMPHASLSYRVTHIALAENGTVYAAVRHPSWMGKLVRITPEGRRLSMTREWGQVSPSDEETREEAPVGDAKIDVAGAELGPDGTLYVNDTLNGRIWRLDADGMLRRFVGTGARGISYSEYGDDGPARLATLGHVHAMAFGPDGALYFSDGDQSTVRRIGDTLPEYDAGPLRVPSDDGQELYEFDSTGRHLKTFDVATGNATATFAYADNGDGDANLHDGPLASVTDQDGNVLRVERDADGKPTAIVAPFGQRTALNVGADGWLESARDPAQRSTTMTYVDDGLLSSFALPGGRTSTFQYDAVGRLVRDDNADGGYKTLTRADEPDAYEVAVTTRRGRTRTLRTSSEQPGETVVTATDAAGVTTTTTDTDGRTVATREDGMRVSTKLAPDPRFKGQAGQVTPYASNVEIRLPSGKTSTTVTSRTATQTHADDPLTTTTFSETTTVSGRVSRTEWDRATRKAKVITPAGRSAVATYDAKGRIVAEQAPDVLGIYHEYDAHGRPTTTTQGTRSSTVAYDPATGWVRSVTDAVGRTTTYDRDALGRVTATHLPGGRTVGYEYDAAGNLQRIVPAGRPAHAFAHSLTGLRTSWTPPLAATTGSTTYNYDVDQQLSSVVRPDGTRIDFDPDAAGRFGSVAHSGQTTTAGYDSVSGELKSLSSTAGYGLDWEYDGTLRTSETATGPVSGGVVQQFDNDGRMTSSRVTGTPEIAYQYDADDLPTTVGALTLTRDAESGVTTATTLAQARTELTYDEYGDVGSLAYRHGTAARFTETVTRDAGGRVTREDETLAGAAARRLDYAYDAAGRLQQVKRDGAVVAEYAYDLNGNRTTETVNGTTTLSTYDDQDRLLSRGGVEYRYTANGDLREKVSGSSSTTYAYDAVGNLKTVGLPDGRQIRYLVDPLGRRVGREIDGARTHGWVYGETARPSAELASDGSIRSRFVYAESTTVPSYMVRDGKTYRFVTDRLGSPRLVVDVETGDVAQELDYDAWGRVVKDTNPGFQPFGFAGGLYESATGLVRFGARDYDPDVGRWTSKDPIGFEGGDTNLYGYVLGDPVNFVDPSGLSIDTALDAGQAGLAAAGALMGCRPWSDVAIAAGAMLIPGVTASMLKGAINAVKGAREGGGALRNLGRRLADERGSVGYGDLPRRARTFGDFDEAAAHLRRYHGVDPRDASRRLHAIKEAHGLGGRENLLIDRTGNVYNPYTRERLGNLATDY